MRQTERIQQTGRRFSVFRFALNAYLFQNNLKRRTCFAVASRIAAWQSKNGEKTKLRPSPTRSGELANGVR